MQRRRDATGALHLADPSLPEWFSTALPMIRANSCYFVYILRCADGTLYTGYTIDLARRLDAHQKGKGARYTRCRLPVTLVYVEVLAQRGEALRREAAIKRLAREEKERLVRSAGALSDTHREP